VQLLYVRGLVGGGEVEHNLVDTGGPVLLDTVRDGDRATVTPIAVIVSTVLRGP
jgi:hypothetical protein